MKYRVEYTYDSPQVRIIKGCSTWSIEGIYDTKEEAEKVAKKLKKDYKVYTYIREVKEDE